MLGWLPETSSRCFRFFFDFGSDDLAFFFFFGFFTLSVFLTASTAMTEHLSLCNSMFDFGMLLPQLLQSTLTDFSASTSTLSGSSCVADLTPEVCLVIFSSETDLATFLEVLLMLFVLFFFCGSRKSDARI